MRASLLLPTLHITFIIGAFGTPMPMPPPPLGTLIFHSDLYRAKLTSKDAAMITEAIPALVDDSYGTAL
ncbi:hypothetical protein FRB94_001486 [Tulasnella sp. JGI-2019a]|nr:hypothetical protein FRB94_001486 [Tulasnella sp. JGI-2019a]